jgi:hypothetical protein
MFILPVAITLAGILWMYAALGHYQRVTGSELRGLIGYHYSSPDWGFEYAPEGKRMERWSFEVPAVVTLIVLLASALVASGYGRRELGLWAIAGLWIYHAGWGLAFLLVYALTWAEAAGVFI